MKIILENIFKKMNQTLYFRLKMDMDLVHLFDDVTKLKITSEITPSLIEDFIFLYQNSKS